MGKKILKKNTEITNPVISNGMETKIYNQEGKEAGSVTLPESVFGLKWNSDLVHQVVVAMQANAREHVAHVKTRGEVAGGGKKPWRQKGTGRARHGSIRSPLWVGGGVTHGPNAEKVYGRKVNHGMKTKALYTILSRKLRDGEILFVDAITVPTAKTKAAKAILERLGTIKGYEGLSKKRENAALVAFSKKDKNAALGLRNFSNIALDEVRNLNPLSLLSYRYLIISEPELSVKQLCARQAEKTS